MGKTPDREFGERRRSDLRRLERESVRQHGQRTDEPIGRDLTVRVHVDDDTLQADITPARKRHRFEAANRGPADEIDKIRGDAQRAVPSGRQSLDLSCDIRMAERHHRRAQVDRRHRPGLDQGCVQGEGARDGDGHIAGERDNVPRPERDRIEAAGRHGAGRQLRAAVEGVGLCSTGRALDLRARFQSRRHQSTGRRNLDSPRSSGEQRERLAADGHGQGTAAYPSAPRPREQCPL